jgi:hypothetical protein
MADFRQQQATELQVAADELSALAATLERVAAEHPGEARLPVLWSLHKADSGDGRPVQVHGDWTPLWAASESAQQMLTPAEADFLSCLRNCLAWPAKSVAQHGYTFIATRMCDRDRYTPALAERISEEPEMYALAAYSQQAELDRALEFLADHAGVTAHQLRQLLTGGQWTGEVISHLVNAGLVRVASKRIVLAAPEDREVLMSETARATAKEMTGPEVAWHALGKRDRNTQQWAIKEAASRLRRSS